MITLDDLAAGLDNPYALGLLITLGALAAAWVICAAWDALQAWAEADINRRVAEALDTVSAEPIPWDDTLPTYGPATVEHLRSHGVHIDATEVDR